MKKYLIIFLVLILCFSFSFSVSAESEEDDASADYLTGVFEIGDEVYYTCEIMYTYRGTEYHWSMDMRTTITETNKMMCLYYNDYSLSGVGYHLNEMGVPGGTENLYQQLKSDGTEYTNQACTNVQPTMYIDTSVYESCYDVYFLTNLPIFESYEAAVAYRSGELGIEKAVNYKKVFENGNWISPFEDIEINDMDILVPTLSNVSHSGFSCTNNNDERYMVEVYVNSGIQDVRDYLDGSSSISDPFVENAFGLVSNNSEAQYNGSSISLFDCYGIDNINALYENLVDFYTLYPNSYSYEKVHDYDYSIIKSKSPCTFDIWGKPFGKNYVFWNNASKMDVSAVDIDTVNEIPLCYTRYRVRYFYFDDASGFHYGPWANVVYFSNGKIVSNAIYQDNDGNVIETTINNGVQDENGNVSYNNSNFIDLNDTNSLFGNLRSIFNNMTATNNSFSQLFGSVFNFLPPEILAIIFGGIAAMVFIGIIKSLAG